MDKRLFPYKLVFAVILFLLYSCKTVIQARLNQNAYDRLTNLNPAYKHANLLVYHFDEDCSVCIAKMSYIEKKELVKLKHKLIFIAQTKNPNAHNFDAKGAKLLTKVYIDTNNSFAKFRMNEVVLVKKNRLVTIDTTYNNKEAYLSL